MTTPVELVTFAAIAFALWYGLMRTEPGARLRSAIGRRMMRASTRAAAGGSAEPPGTTTGEDHRFLLEKCRGDERELFRRLEAEQRRNPRLDEAEVYRKAIRTWFVENRGGTHGSIGEDLDDTWL